MFMGTYHNSIDAKNRMIVPAKYREKLGDGCIVTRGLDACLVLYSYEDWEKQMEKMEKLPESDPAVRAFIRHFYGNAAECGFDKQGRIVIPGELLAYAQINKELMELSAQERGLTYALMGGVEKIRLSGAENRVFTKWLDLYTRGADLKFNPPVIVKFQKVFNAAITLTGTIVMYFIAVKTRVSVADYYAFNTAYAYVSGALNAITSVAIAAATVKPSLELIRPLMEAEPEKHVGRESVATITGNIELSHVTFRYEKEGRKIIDDLSLKIPARQYVAIVGKTGCGKSTLLRLLLGFEKPESGAIFYDRKDIQTLDLGSLRKLIGTVLQEGELFSGSIFENITISAPNLTLQEAWDAAEIAGIADDIRAMPMGMSTVLQEGGGGISGGQKQRIMIARAQNSGGRQVRAADREGRRVRRAGGEAETG